MEPILPWGLTKGSASDARFTLATRERKCYLLGDKSLAVIVTIAFSVVGVLGDYLLKLSSSAQNPLKTRWFYLGFVVYASTAFGWVFVMKHLKLGTIGVIYSVSMILLLTGIGVVFFKEPLSPYELVGLAMAVASLFLLIRFA
jgi:drug/metabolite transporter (DMT)-like permease